MTRLRDVDPAALAIEIRGRLMKRIGKLAMAAGITTPVPEPSWDGDALLAVCELAAYAVSGAPPEGDLGLVEEYLQSVSTYAAWLGEPVGWI